MMKTIRTAMPKTIAIDFRFPDKPRLVKKSSNHFFKASHQLGPVVLFPSAGPMVVVKICVVVPHFQAVTVPLPQVIT